MSLPTDAQERKAIPIYSGCIAYFPNALAEVARLSKIGNDQHNPGSPLHWDRSKSGDELDALMRHLTDHAANVPMDTDGVPHLAKVAWRALAMLEKTLEKQAAPEVPLSDPFAALRPSLPLSLDIIPLKIGAADNGSYIGLTRDGAGDVYDAVSVQHRGD